MKIVCLGTGPFAVPTFERLCQGPHEVLGVVTRPDRAEARKRKAPQAPMRVAAEQRGVRVLAPPSVNREEGLQFLLDSKPDLLFVCDYGEILKPAALESASLGGINLHGSLLPRHRGAAPVHAAILAGDSVTGVSVIHMTPGLDAGPVLALRTTEIGKHENQIELEARLSQLGVEAVLEAIERLEAWDRVSPIGQMQDASKVTAAPRLKKEQSRIDWTRSATMIDRQVRGFQPWPGSDTLLVRESQQPLRVLIERAEVVEQELETTAAPGSILEATRQGVVVKAGEGSLRVLAVKPEGKRSMGIADFLNGVPLSTADRFE